MEEQVKYYEFDKQEYYALIVVKGKFFDAYNKAFKIYVEYVGGEDVYEVKREGSPTELTKDQALLRFIKAKNNENETVGNLIKQFEKAENFPLLIDGSLL